MLVSTVEVHVLVDSLRVCERGCEREIWSGDWQLIEVSIRLRCMRSRSIHSHKEKYLMSMWRVPLVGFWAFPIAVHPSLSLYAIVAAS